MARLEVDPHCIYNAKARERLSRRFEVWTFLLALQSPFFFGTIFTHDIRLLLTASTILLAALVAFARKVESDRLRAVVDFGEFLRPKLEAKYGISLSGLMHVGISPGRAPVNYMGDCSWDIGFLDLDGGLTFYGDQSQFFLPGDSICWARNDLFSQFLRVEYRVAGTDELRYFSIHPRGVRDRTGRYLAIHQLRAKIALLPNHGKPLVLGMPPFEL